MGAIVAALGLAYWQQQRAHAAAIAAAHEARVAAQEARVRDAQEVMETLLTLTDKWQTTLGELTQAVGELRIVTTERRGRS
jgi:hypothetical protein